MKHMHLLLALIVTLFISACGGGITTPAATVPASPTIGTAVAGNTQATVSFSVPANNGGSAITSYTVTSSPGNISVSGTSSPITVTGLTNGTAYTFTVTATTGAGTSVPSTASNAVTPSLATIIPAMPYNGSVSTMANSYYSYTTVGTINKIDATALTDDIDPVVYTDATFTVVDANWVCTASVGVTPDSCAAATPVPAGTILYIAAINYTGGLGATFTLNAANVAVTPSQGAANAPLVITMPYNGLVGTVANSYYSYTTVGTVNSIDTTIATLGVAYSAVYTDATFTIQDPNWSCMTWTNCTALTPVPAGTILYIQVWNYTGGLGATFTLNVANVAVIPSEGAANAPLVITMPYNGLVGTVANSYYLYTTVGTVNSIDTTLATAGVGSLVYTDATFTTQDFNWSCMTMTNCTALTPVPAGTILYIQVWNLSGGLGATFTLNVANVAVTPSQGAANAPVAITLPYSGLVGTVADSYYSYTTAAATSLITATALTNDIDPLIFTDATFTAVDANWTCTVNYGVTPDTCTATTAVPAGTVLYIRAINYTGSLGAGFILQ